MSNPPFYAPNRQPPAARTPVAGTPMWQLRRTDHVTVCEIRDDVRLKAGVDVQIIEDGELVLAQRTATMTGAKQVAEALKQDYVRAGWRETVDEA